MSDGFKRSAGSHLAVGAQALLREMVGPGIEETRWQMKI